jgi:AcrR family transcriptional regulator
VSLAEAAGVTRPVVYDHFQTRAGLLIALYDEIAARQLAILSEQLSGAEPQFDVIAEAASRAYMRCYATVGPEAFAIVAALRGDTAMDQYVRTLLRRYVDAYVDAFRPHTNLDDHGLKVRCTAIVGAAEALSNLMLDGAIDEPEAAEALFSLIINWLDPGAQSVR